MTELTFWPQLRKRSFYTVYQSGDSTLDIYRHIFRIISRRRLVRLKILSRESSSVSDSVGMNAASVGDEISYVATCYVRTTTTKRKKQKQNNEKRKNKKSTLVHVKPLNPNTNPSFIFFFSRKE